MCGWCIRKVRTEHTGHGSGIREETAGMSMEHTLVEQGPRTPERLTLPITRRSGGRYRWSCSSNRGGGESECLGHYGDAS